MYGPSYDRITTALESAVGPGRPSGSWTKFCCPSHEGDGRHHKPSLAIKYDQNQQKTVVKCFSGCDNEQVLETMGLRVRDLYDKPLARERGRAAGPARRVRPQRISRADQALAAEGMALTQPKKKELGRQTSAWRTTATYPYMRPDGTVAGEVIRKEATFEAGRDKSFHQRRWNDQTGQMERGGFEPLPFQLPQVLEKIADGGVIYICEGEKDVLSAEQAGLTATTNAGGALSWTPEHARWLTGARTVVIVADHDVAGYRRAERVMGTLAGLVQRVRVVTAATGKDLTDHLQLGHEISELVPIPYLDPETRPSAAPSTTAAAPTATADASHSPETTATAGGSVPEYMLAPSLNDHAPDHTPDVDTMGQHWSRFTQMLLQQMLQWAAKQALARKAAAETMALREEQERREAEARRAAEQKAVEVRLAEMSKRGWDKASRSEVAAAVRDSVEWAADSEAAKKFLAELGTHVNKRFGLALDPETGQVRSTVTPELAEALYAAESERALSWRVHRAGDRMVEVVAQQASLDQSEKEALYAEIKKWRDAPGPERLQALTKALADKKVHERPRTEIRFIAGYLGPDALVPLGQLGTVASVNPVAELRKLPAPLVDPGEEVKPRVDQLLEKYQDRMRHGLDTTKVTAELGEAVAVMTEEDRAIARERGKAIRSNPVQKFEKLWPEHVDRDELASDLRMLAVLAPQIERQAAKAGDLDATTSTEMRKRAALYRGRVQNAIKNGKGLHQLEKDQLQAVLGDIEAGVTKGVRSGSVASESPAVPELLFADDKSAAAVEAARSEDIARETTRASRHQLEQILTSNRVPEGTLRRTQDAVTRVMQAQTNLAAGRGNLADYEARGVDRELDTHLVAAGVAEPVRNQIRKHLDWSAGEAATAGKQANRAADKWIDRHEAVVAARSGAPAAASGYDSPERLAQREQQLRDAGLNDRQVAARMAVDAGRTQPPSAAAGSAPAAGNRKRRTPPGAGVNRTHHRGGPGNDLGRGL
ncbi:toprim domain-containing protein [Nocardia cyriacigeorgica]|uniref:toprim domain-containing protein n=1 Tax=Nocardia cyriacigeorgica TaxID=135487 RepID=UPI002457ADF0|nr:toprim domain-containing protein [Nocardia cyriacigeorgica]